MHRFESILFIGPDYKKPKGGIGSVLAIYAKYIQPFHFVITYKGNKPAWRNFVVFCVSIIRLFKILISNKTIKLVHIHGSHGGSVYRKGILFFIAKKLFGKKVIYHQHSSSFDLIYKQGNMLYKFLCKWIIGNADLMITLSKSWHEYYASFFRPKKLSILNNIVDYPNTEFAGSDNSNARFKILFLGEIGQRKGIYDLIQVINENKNAWINKVVFQIGGNGETEMLKHFIKNNELSELIEFIGWVDNEKKNYYLNNVDAYILPSYNEGLPISILEAMSYSLPVISTNVGGIPEVVKDNFNGFLVNPGDLQALKDRIEAIINADIIQRNQFGINSLKIVSEYYPDVVFKSLGEIYKSIL